jgi:anti-anti-sigma factor
VEDDSGIRTQRLGQHVWLISLKGEYDMAGRDDLVEAMSEAFHAGSTLIVDLAETTFIDSSVVSALIDAHERAISHASDDLLVVAPPGTAPRRVLDLTGVGGAIKVYDHRSAAIAAAKTSPADLRANRRERRLAHNEVLFRLANNRIERHAQSLGIDEPIAFFCECADRDCTERISVTIAEYERAHALPTRFLLRPGHEEPDIEHITDRTPEYVVVQKDGSFGSLAASQLD